MILSSGFRELIEPVLEREGVALEVHANRLDVKADGWRAIWRDDAQCVDWGEGGSAGGLPGGAPVVGGGGLLGPRAGAGGGPVPAAGSPPPPPTPGPGRARWTSSSSSLLPWGVVFFAPFWSDFLV